MMNKDYSAHLNKMVEDGIIMKGQINDVVFGLKEISDKLDTLIALKQVELSRPQQRQEPRCQKEQG